MRGRMEPREVYVFLWILNWGWANDPLRSGQFYFLLKERPSPQGWRSFFWQKAQRVVQQQRRAHAAASVRPAARILWRRIVPARTHTGGHCPRDWHLLPIADVRPANNCILAPHLQQGRFFKLSAWDIVCAHHVCSRYLHLEKQSCFRASMNFLNERAFFFACAAAKSAINYLERHVQLESAGSVNTTMGWMKSQRG